VVRPPNRISVEIQVLRFFAGGEAKTEGFLRTPFGHRREGGKAIKSKEQQTAELNKIEQFF
jgi:hypothetical protein